MKQSGGGVIQGGYRGRPSKVQVEAGSESIPLISKQSIDWGTEGKRMSFGDNNIQPLRVNCVPNIANTLGNGTRIHVTNARHSGATPLLRKRHVRVYSVPVYLDVAISVEKDVLWFDVSVNDVVVVKVLAQKQQQRRAGSDVDVRPYQEETNCSSRETVKSTAKTTATAMATTATA